MTTMHAIGNVAIRQVVEMRGPGFTPDFLFPDWDQSVLEEHRALMIPDCFERAHND